MKNWNLSKNQEIKGRLVGGEVIHCANEMMWELQNNGGYSDEIMELFYSNIDWEQMAENVLYELSDLELKQVLDELELEKYNDVDDPELFINTAVYEGYVPEPEAIYSEPYEFWIVSEWFGEKLKEQGGIVEDFMGFTIWGRETTGQAILLDGIISRIAEDMEILEGQANEWKV